MFRRVLLTISILLLLALVLVSCEKKTTEPQNQCATPLLSPAAGTYADAQNVSITCATVGATIVYTTDGSAPTSNSAVYTSPIAITANTTVKAQAFRTGWTDSQIVSATYTIGLSQIVTPTFNPPSGTYTSTQNVTISCATDGASIRYTTNGSDPTSSSTLYSSPINVSSTTTVKAKAFKSGWTDSQIASSTYTIGTTPGQMVLVQSGTFNNGTSNVTLSSFYLDKYELTQSEYQAVMGTNPSYFHGVTNGPVEQVTWFDAIEYCNRRSINEGLTPCYSYSTFGTNPATWPGDWNSDYNNHTNVSCNWTATGYRLPTEAEWQFAARGGNSTHNYTYSGSEDINAVAWYNGNSGNTTHTVGTKTANELGLFDMSGNVWEWNWDIFGSYSNGSQTNPHGVVSGPGRVVRGGSWYNDDYCTVSSRGFGYATYNYNYLAFRCVRVSP